MTDNPSASGPRLGKLESVELREVWAHEARDFTPWLLANAEALGEVLDMDLEITAAEHPVGGFSLDLVGKDLRTNERVIVENQLEGTDHSHLGQLLTYAAGTDATNVVWVAQEFREEHRAALDWLNGRTDSTTRFFGVEVAAVRIGDSLPAPLFRVVAQPNDWGKTVRTTAQAHDELGERGQFYVAFWESYLTALREANLAWTKARKSPTQNWFPMPSGATGAEYIVSFSRQGLLSELFFGHPDPEVNRRRFERLLGMRDDLEKVYGGSLEFEPLEGRKGCRIGVRRPGDIADRGNWPLFIKWFVDTQGQLRAAVTAAGGVGGVGMADPRGQFSGDEAGEPGRTHPA